MSRAPEGNDLSCSPVHPGWSIANYRRVDLFVIATSAFGKLLCQRAIVEDLLEFSEDLGLTLR